MVHIYVPGLTPSAHALIEHTSAMIKDGAVTNVKVATDIDASKLGAGLLALARIPTPLTGKVATDIKQGLDAGKGAAGTAGKIYFATDTAKLYVDDGSAWQDCKPLPYIGTAGDTLWAYADVERNTEGTSYVKVKEIKLDKFSGSLRIKFDMKIDVYTGENVYARIYKNGAAVGTEQSTSSSTYSTKSEDISGLTDNDLVQLYIRSVTGRRVDVRNFRLYSAETLARSRVVTD